MAARKKNNRWSSAILQPQKVTASRVKMVGRLPVDCMLAILQYSTLPDVMTLGRCSREMNALSKDNRVWAMKLALLDFRGLGQGAEVIRRRSVKSSADISKEVPAKSSTISKIKTDELDEDAFGDFVDVTPARHVNDLLLDFDNGAEEDIGMNIASPRKKEIPKAQTTQKHRRPQNGSVDISSQNGGVSLRDVYKTAYITVLPYYLSMQTHTTSSLVFSQHSLTPLDRAHMLSVLVRLLLPALSPTRSSATITVFRRNLLSSIDHFEGSLLAEFERADTQNDELAMTRCAKVAWELQSNPTASSKLTSAGSNLFQVFLNKREVFYDQSHNPMKNLVKLPAPDGARRGEVVDGIDFAAMDRYMSFILDVIAKDGALIARVFPTEADLLLDFAERLAQDAISEYVTPLLSSAQNLQSPLFLLATAASFVESSRLVDGILAITPKSPRVNRRRTQEVIFRMFEVYMDDYLSEEGEWIKTVLEGLCKSWNEKIVTDPDVGTSLFLASTNAAQAKRNVMSSFGKALLLPVTVVPKTVVYSLNAVTTGAFNAVVQIGAGIGGLAGGKNAATVPNGVTTLEAAQELQEESSEWQARQSLEASGMPLPAIKPDQFAKLQLLLSLDVALQLIQADRDCLKRIQTFAGYSGAFGRKVRDAIEEVFIILLQTLGEKHILPAFRQAEHHMKAYKPAEHEADSNVGPLAQFFELVHIGDTISQMIHVFYDAEMVNYIDRTDFLNVVVREKKKFESSIDDSVASGLNIGVQLLMGQAEHLMLTQQEVTDFCPPDDVNSDLGPTPACSAVIECLQIHCNMLKGCADKQILEVFYVEIGLRLHGLILKHLKRAVISPTGGLQVMSDINAYHAFIASLRQATIMPYFTALKMVSNLYIVDSPKDLASLVKDVQRYEGTLRSEDAYELLQRRTDWRLKEKAVDKALYGLSTDDCILQ